MMRTTNGTIHALVQLVAEPLGVALDHVSTNLESVLILEDPFTRVEQMLCWAVII